MFQFESYLAIALAINSGALTLLGSVGIFVSLIIQRRVERLQDILEEFTDLSYHQDINLTGKMYKLLQKYQMQYLLPDRPSQTILAYIDVTTLFVIVSWLVLIIMTFTAPWNMKSFFYLIPLLWGLILLILFRQLLKYAINPVGNKLLQTIIPPPTKLRSVSFLSSYINVSVLSILQQARLSLVIRLNISGHHQHHSLPGEIILKQELSFDDFFYYIQITQDEKPIFLGLGELEVSFPNDPLTNKPVPIQRNVNIPLGRITFPADVQMVQCQLLIFARGEKHPIIYRFDLFREGKVFCVNDEPRASIYTGITYKINQDRLELVESNYQSAWLEYLFTRCSFNNKRIFFTGNSLKEPIDVEKLCSCLDQIYVK